MIKWITVFPLILGMISLAACAQMPVSDNQAEAIPKELNCELDNSSLRDMPIVEVLFTRSDSSVFLDKVRLANTNETRAAGFQRVCASTIAATPILFAFRQEAQVAFHMHNVVAPIDIAFIDQRGGVESIQAMQPYSLVSLNKPLYGPKRPVLYALEVHPGYFEKHRISLKSHFSWTPLK